MEGDRIWDRLHIPETAKTVRSEGSWSHLEEKCIGIFDCPHSTPNYTEDGPLVARSQDIRSGVFRAERAAHVSDKTYRDRTARAIPAYGDLLYSREGTYFGIAAEVPRDLEVCLGQRMVLIRPNPNVLNCRYLKYWLNSPFLQAYIHGLRDGSVAERLNLSTIRRLPVCLHSLEEQQAIACILGALDDKIELNRRMNETLEAMAQAIFKSWFVDFDPVCAKDAGQQPLGLKREIASLFPDSFEDSELGSIPKGWRVGTLEDLAEINSWTLGKRDRLEDIDYIEISQVTCGEIATITRYSRGTEPGRARRRLRHGDTAISMVRPDRGAYFLAIDPSPTLIASTGFAVLTAHEGRWAFVHVLTTRKNFGEELGRLADGGAYPAIRPEVIADRPVAIPSSFQLTAAFEEIVQPIFLRSDKGRQETRTLAAMRDALLPKLISGQLRVPDAELIVGEYF